MFFAEFLYSYILPAMLVFTGLLLSFRTGFLQFRAFREMFRATVGGMFAKSDKSSSVTPFQTLCTALSATVGTGNIAGVAFAVSMGGPGAVFWMWVAAFIGMITKYTEAALGVYFRKKTHTGNIGGAMYYLKYGVGAKKGLKRTGELLAVLFSLSTIAASFGIGNMSQSAVVKDSIVVLSGDNCSDFTAIGIGIILMLCACPVILGGAGKILKANEKLVPFMALFYIAGASAVIILRYQNIIPAFISIFKGAFCQGSVSGGVSGYAISLGLRRGIFSNEAGLGSAASVYAKSDCDNPYEQGLWGMLEVFIDTIVICTLTALAILTTSSSGEGGGMALAVSAFSSVFGRYGGLFVSVSLVLFAYSSILGWSFYGCAAWSFLFGEKSVIIYKILFTSAIVIGCITDIAVIMGLSDLFNCFMAIPNLTGLIILSGNNLPIFGNSIKKER